MSEKEKEILEKLARVFPILPTDKQEYFLGYAEADVVAHSEMEVKAG